VIIHCVWTIRRSEIEFRAIAVKLKALEPLEEVSSQSVDQFARRPSVIAGVLAKGGVPITFAREILARAADAVT